MDITVNARWRSVRAKVTGKKDIGRRRGTSVTGALSLGTMFNSVASDWLVKTVPEDLMARTIKEK